LVTNIIIAQVTRPKRGKMATREKAIRKEITKKELMKKEDKSSSFKRSKGLSHVAALSASSNSDAWYIDSGATAHMTNRKDWLHNYSDCGSKEIKIANGDKLDGFVQANVIVIMVNVVS
jgi:beta-glucanase (GH16 family)